MIWTYFSYCFCCSFSIIKNMLIFSRDFMQKNLCTYFKSLKFIRKRSTLFFLRSSIFKNQMNLFLCFLDNILCQIKIRFHIKDLPHFVTCFVPDSITQHGDLIAVWNCFYWVPCFSVFKRSKNGFKRSTHTSWVWILQESLFIYSVQNVL